MKRSEFLKKGALGLGSLASAAALTSSCTPEEMGDPNCPISPTEIAGPFPIKTPAQMVMENIVGNRTGIALRVNFTIQDSNDGCKPMVGALVDLWQCDARGNYSEYDRQIDGDLTNENFLRGRQVTDANGEVSFLSIYPGWYPGRAPHLHVEVLDSEGRSLLVTQVAFPEDTSEAVYASTDYNGSADTSNERDGGFRDSLEANMPESVVGNNADGYLLSKILKVNGG